MSGWYYDFPKAAPRPKPKPGKAGKKFGATWWGKKWIDMLSKYEHDQRMSRGRAYARADMVSNFKVDAGRIIATVKGSMGNYKVKVNFKVHSNKDWGIIINKLGETPIVLSSLLNNELPENVDKITGFAFIPKSFNADCSCPDYANPCKHIAAVFYTMADEIDYDPMILFKIKGMDKNELLTKLGIVDREEHAADLTKEKSLQSKHKKTIKKSKYKKPLHSRKKK